MKKIVLGGITLILLGALLFFLDMIFFGQNTINGVLKLKGLKGEVIVARDQFGVPHIEATDYDEDAFFALGFVHAQDRFWQMEFQRRVAQGTLSEIFGNATLAQDKHLRSWGFYRAARDTWEALSPRTQAFIRSYTQGVNAFLENENLPLQIQLLRYKPEPWTPIDSIVWQKMMAWDLQRSWEEKLTNHLILTELGERQIPILRPPYPKDAPTVLNGNNAKQAGFLKLEEQILTSQKRHMGRDSQNAAIAEMLTTVKAIRTQLGFHDVLGKGSNSWVISGRLTKSKLPILANDIHLQLSAPGLWYLATLKGPQLNIAGATIPGLPFVLIGHNDFIGWGITDATVDAQDLYLEPQDVQLTVVTEQIKIKGEKSVSFTMKASSHGPLINSLLNNYPVDQPIAIKWVALQPGDQTIEAFFKLNYAYNWETFTDALSYLGAPALNFTYADIYGNIGYRLAGKIPLRKKWVGTLPLQPLEHHQWQGYIPFEKLPYLFNPSLGYIASANNKITPDSYPFSLTFRWMSTPYRIQRIHDLIRQWSPLTIPMVKAMQQDTVSYLWQDLREILLKTKPIDQTSQRALEELSAWKGDTEITSTAATIFAFWYRELSQLMPKKIAYTFNGPEPLFIKQQLQNGNGTYCQISFHKTCSEVLSHTLHTAMLRLIKQQGSNRGNWQWGDVHQVTFKDLGFGSTWIGGIWSRNISTSGGYDTVNVGNYDMDTFEQTIGANYRQILDFSNFQNSQYVLSFGQSGNVFSPHYGDQMLLWRDGKYLPLIAPKKETHGMVSQLRLRPLT